MSQNDPKTASLMMSVTKNLHPQPKNFFRVQSRRLADLFERLNRSLVQLVEELWQWFPTFLGLRHPTKQKYNFWHLVANP